MHLPKYALFYDFHTSPDYPGVGERFEAGKFADYVKQCGVDYLTFHARCNMGMAYYDTRIGIRHPALKFDLFGQLAEACRERGIALTAYFNAGISREEGIRHRDWTTLYFDGKNYQEPRVSPFSMTMCYNSPYREHLMAMIREVAETYPVAGFFLDCMTGFPCICPRCVREMRERGIDGNDLAAVTEFGRFSAKRLADEVAAMARKINPEYLLYFNNVAFEDQQQSGSYLEFECLPCRDGYGYIPVMMHFMRTLGNPCVNMTGRFNRWGDFGSLLPEAAVKSELLYGLAHGLRPNLGDHLLPDGSLNPVVMDYTKAIFGELRKLEPWTDGAKPVVEIAVVYPKPHPNIRFDAELRGVTRMLEELQQPFDIVTMSSSWESYQLLIFPDSVIFSDEISRRVRTHLAAGKKVIASAWSGLNTESAFPEGWGVVYQDKCEFSPAYFLAGSSISGKEVPDMPFTVFGDGLQVAAKPETETAAVLIRPALNSGWTGIYPEYYTPPYEKTDLPFLTFSDSVAYFSHALFRGYHQKGSIHLRKIFAYALRRMLPDPLLKINSAPSFLRVAVTRQPGRLMVHLFGYIPEKRGTEAEIVEDELLVPPLELQVRQDGRIPVAVYLAPGKTPLACTAGEGYWKIPLPQFQGHCLAVLEF